MVAELTYYFRDEAKAGIVRTTKNRAAIIGVFVYGIVFMLSIATVSFRDLFGLPVLNFAFNTTIPTIMLTYIAMTAVLYWAIPKNVKTR
jgi:hypothetical protein